MVPTMPKLLKTKDKGSVSGPTYINRLPEDVIQNILMNLSIQEAVKTSILSRDWRYVWTKLPQLVFDDSFCEKSILNTKNELIITIYQVLLLHNGPLCKFTLCLRNLDGKCFQTDQFLLVALERGVKDLMVEIKEGEPYISPLSIFGYGQQLEHLELRSCVFKPPFGFNGFGKLKTLQIEEIDICGKRLSSLISNCPLLTWLELVGSTSTGCLDIVAPNLEYLSLDFQGMLICLKNTPRLVQFEIFSKNIKIINIPNEASGDFMLFGNLPVLEALTLDSFYLQYATSDRAPKSLVNDICRLKILSLFNICFGVRNDVISTLCLIRNIPNLEKLLIDVRNVVTARNVEHIGVDDYSDFSLGYLRVVEFSVASGLKGELQFIKLILAKSPALEKFAVNFDRKLARKTKWKFCKELSRYRRASPLAEIAYED